MKNTRSRGYYLSAFLILVSVLSISVSGCGSPATWENASLEFITALPLINSPENADLNLSNYSVIRCGSLAETDSVLTLGTSKSMSLLPVSLLLIPPLTDAETQGSVLIILTSVTGKEYEYDLTGARVYEVSSGSARTAVTNYGIPFTDWEYGAVNGSEKFPCCE